MKYFHYILKDIGNGESIGPASYLPEGSETGRIGPNDILYGMADIGSVSVLSDFNAVEVNRDDFPWTKDEAYANAIADGYDTGLGYRIGLGDKDRTQFVSTLVLLREANAPAVMITAIADNTGTLHQLSVQALRQLLVGYGTHYQALWSASKASGSLV